MATGKARAAIRRATREAIRAQYLGFGRQIVTRAFERAGKDYSETALRTALPRLARDSVDDVLASVGRGEMHSGDVVRAVHRDFREETKEERQSGVVAAKTEGGWFGLKKAASMLFRVPSAPEQSAIPITGLRGDLPVNFAPNGGAVPGDRIVGILTPGEGITIYPIQSPDLTAFDDQPDRWLDVRWDIDESRKDNFPARIKVTALNEPGTLGMVATLIGETGANIDHVTFHAPSPEFREMQIDVSVWDIKHLNSIITQLKAKAMVSKVERVNG